jgi:hypothetical protein
MGSWINGGLMYDGIVLLLIGTIAVLPFAPSDCQCTFAEFHSLMSIYRSPFALIALWPT